MCNFTHRNLNIKIMKTEENKKQEELTDEQLDNVSGGAGFGKWEYYNNKPR